VVTGVPTKSYRLPTEWIQPHTVLVNVASFKNVDEEALLRIPGVVYVPQVGKVTVAMLERNLIRLYDQFHHPTLTILDEEKSSWWDVLTTPSSVMHLYTAVTVTALLVLQLCRKPH
jgi:hypothetical protein